MRPSRAAVSAGGFAAGCAAIGGGVYLVLGLGFALIAAGALAAAACVLLVDVDGGKHG
ncbi:MAG: hypothetical protein ACRDMV_18125 [Streptosporangiales bacterium]